MPAIKIVWKNQNHEPVVLAFEDQQALNEVYDLLGRAMFNKDVHSACGRMLINASEILYAVKVVQ